MNISVISINAKYYHTPLAALSIAANCGLPVRVFDFNINQSDDYMISRIYAANPDIAAFSCYIWNIEIIKRLVRIIKTLLPKTLIVLGGPEVTHNPEPYEGENIIIVRGEGEAAFADIVNREHRISQNRECRIIQNRERGHPARIIQNPPHLNKLKSPYENYIFKDSAIVYCESQRGCPFCCAFCLQSAADEHNKPYQEHRFLPLPKVYKQLKYLISKNIQIIKFTDRTFNADPERALNIWRFLAQNDNGVTRFHFEIAADLLTQQHFELFKTLRSGYFRFEAGVQSTNPETLKAINRTADTKLILSNMKKVKDTGNIETHLGIIAGLPYEDYASFAETFNDTIAADPDMLQLGFLKLIHGSALRNSADKFGIIYKQDPPYEVLYTRDITAAELFRLKNIEKIVDIYYNSKHHRNAVTEHMKSFPSPFNFFENLALYWEERNYFGHPHAQAKITAYLQDFTNTENRPQKIMLLINKHYRDKIHCYLNYTKPYELLFAAMLSAQCTDERVNDITSRLFKKYASIESFADADLPELEEDIKQAGLYRTKAKNIKNAAADIINRFNGDIPYKTEDLTSLPGVGRKTANIIRAHIYNIPCIAVDTHVARVSKRLGLTAQTDPVKIELELMEIIPKEFWRNLNTRFIAHGRAVCTARKPKCPVCFLSDICPKTIKKTPAK